MRVLLAKIRGKKSQGKMATSMQESMPRKNESHDPEEA